MTRKLLAVLIAVVGLAGVVVAVVVRGGGTEDRGTSAHLSVTAVDIDVDAGRVDVVGGAADASVVRTRHYLRGAPTIEQTVTQGVLHLRTRCPAFPVLGCRVDVRLDLPATTTVRVRTKRGDITVAGMTGGADVATSAGAISLTATSGPITATTSAGAIAGADLAPTFVDAKTAAGAIRMTLAQPAARLNLQAGAGAVDLALPIVPGGYRVTATSAAGKADVAVDQEATSPRAVTVHTGAGGITVHSR